MLNATFTVIFKHQCYSKYVLHSCHLRTKVAERPLHFAETASRLTSATGDTLTLHCNSTFLYTKRHLDLFCTPILVNTKKSMTKACYKKSKLWLKISGLRKNLKWSRLVLELHLLQYFHLNLEWLGNLLMKKKLRDYSLSLLCSLPLRCSAHYILQYETIFKVHLSHDIPNYFDKNE